MERPALQRLLADIGESLVDLALAYRSARRARDDGGAARLSRSDRRDDQGADWVRQGKRTDLKADEPRDNCPKVEPGKRTAEVILRLVARLPVISSDL